MKVRKKLTSLAMVAIALVGGGAFIAATPSGAEAGYYCRQYSRHNYCLSYGWRSSGSWVYWG